MSKRRPEAILDVYKLLLGALLFVSPWLFAFAGGAAATDARADGAVIAVASLAALLAFAEWEEWVMLLAGPWMVLSPFVLGFQHTTAMHVSIGIGLAVSYLAVLDLWLIHYGPRAMEHHG
jgi:mannitol-specific phosphotransferase system IIBC component